MKKKQLCFFVAITVVVVANLMTISSIDTNFNLKFGDVEALAELEEEKDGYELRIGICEDGVEEYTSCEFDPASTVRKCDMSDERDCSPGNTPSNPGETQDNEACVQNGHMYYTTSCYQYCSRCSYKKYTCNDKPTDPTNPTDPSNPGYNTGCVMGKHSYYYAGAYKICRYCNYSEYVYTYRP